MLARGFAELDNSGSRQAFLHTLRSVVEPGGQRVSAHDRLALADRMPSLIVWGERDSIIPVAHGVAAHEAMPGSRLVRFEDAGHMPQEDHPHRFAAVLGEFCATTEPARLTHDHWGARGVTAERLSALDASFLAVESPTAPMHVGWVSTFAAPEDGPRPGFDELFAFLAGRLALAPRWRQKLAPVPFGVHEPAWVDDPDFDPAEHVLHAPGDNLDAIADAVFSSRSHATARCGRSGSPTGCRTAASRMIGKAHHCMVDGIAIVELGKLMLDAEPFEDRGEAETWEPVPAPSRRERFARAVVTAPLTARRWRWRRSSSRARPGRLLGVPGSPARSRTRCFRPRPNRLSTSPARRAAATCGDALAQRPAHDPARVRRDAQRRRARRPARARCASTPGRSG